MEFFVNTPKIDKKKFLENLEIGPENEKWMGLDKYESFNSLSEKEKNLVIEQLTKDCLKILPYQDKISESIDEMDVYDENFEDIPFEIQEKKVSSYINRVLNG